MTDQLTGLHNRRYLDNHLAGLFSDPRLRERPVAGLILDTVTKGRREIKRLAYLSIAAPSRAPTAGA